MALVRIQDVTVFGGPAYVVNSEDGPVTTCDYYVGVTVEGGREFQHPRSFRRPYHAETQLAERVRDRGSIETEYWQELPPRMPLEERWALYAEREEEVRMGLRSEDDMFHGIPL